MTLRLIAFLYSTRDIIRTGICGFLTFAEAVMNLPHGPTFVKHVRGNQSTQSTLECVFSQVRSVHRDTADQIGDDRKCSGAVAQLSTGNFKGKEISTLPKEALKKRGSKK